MTPAHDNQLQNSAYTHL